MSQKVVDRAGRWRNRTVAFRVSEEEAAQIDAFVALSGLSKQEYCASRLLQKEVTVKPSSQPPAEKHLQAGKPDLSRTSSHRAG